MTSSIKNIKINGEEIVLTNSNLAGLLMERAIEKKQGGVAVAVNGKVVPRAEWDKTQINKDDRIEIVHIVRGG